MFNPGKPGRPKFSRWDELLRDILEEGLDLNTAAKKYGISLKSIYRYFDKHPDAKQAYYSQSWADPAAATRAQLNLIDWFSVRQDLLFHKLNVKEVAEKYEIDPKLIRMHLARYPVVKDAYYSRSWASPQSQLQFLPEICLFTHEAIDDIYSGVAPEIYSYESPEYRRAISHLTSCDRCQDYEAVVKQKSKINYRFDCPSLSKIYATTGENNIQITEHFLTCPFCKTEYYGLLALTPEKLEEVLENEFSFYPFAGWRSYLKPRYIEEIKAILENPLFKEQGIPPTFVADLKSPSLQSYFKWRIFRTPIFEMGLTSEQEGPHSQGG